MPDWSFSLRRSDSKDKLLPPGTRIKPARAMTAPQDVLRRQGSTTTLDKSRNNTTRPFTPSTMPTSQLRKRLSTRTASPQSSLMNVGRTASPSSSIDDLTFGSSPLPNGHRDQRRNSSMSGVLVSKDDYGLEKGSGDGREVVAASQATADIQTTFTASGDEPSNSTSDDALSLTTKPIPSATDPLTTGPTLDDDTAANLILPREPPVSEVNGAVSEELSSELGNVPSTVVLVPTSDDPPRSAGQTGLLPMAEVALDPELPITPEQLIDPSSSSQGSIITAPAPTNLTEDSPTNPPAIVRNVIDKEVLPVNTDSRQSLRGPSNSTRAEIKETPVGEIPNMDDPPPLISESRGSELTLVVNLSPIVEEIPDTTSGSTLSIRVPLNSTRAEITETSVGGITPDPNTDDPPLSISESRGSELAMVVALSPIVEETPDTSSETSIGTGDDAPTIKPIHHDSQKPNILFFGETGAGKSSVINMLMNSDDAGTSNAADGKTSSFESFITSVDGQCMRLWDTAGLNEAVRGTVPAKVAMQNLQGLVGALREGIALLVYCFRATRFRPSLKDNYDLVHGTICQGKVPIFIVITGLENELPMDAWWAENEADFSQSGMSFDGHACVTSTRGKRKEGGGHMYDTEFQESQRVLRKLIKDYFATPRPSWTIKDNKTWVLETSSKIDNHYDGKNQRVENSVGSSDGLPAPPTQSWWEYVRSFV